MKTAISTMLTVGGIFVVTTGHAQTNESQNPFQPVQDFIDKYQIVLRQSTIDKNALEKPASFQFVNSRDGAGDSYAIDFGLTANVIPNTDPAAATWYVGPTVEYHRQTQTSKPQDNFQAGLTVIKQFGDVSESGLAHFVQLSGKYKHDGITVGEAFLGKLDYTPVYPKLWIGKIDGPDWLRFVWQPSLGIQFEDGSDIMKSKQSGTDTRSKVGVDLGLYPFGKALKNHLELTASYVYWHSLVDSGQFNNIKDDRTLFKTSVIYYLDPKRLVGVGVEYTNGEDVEQGLQKQENIIALIKVKF